MKKFIAIVFFLICLLPITSCNKPNENIANNWNVNKEYHWHTFIENNKSTDYEDQISVIDKERHIFSEWTINRIPTLHNEGSKYRTCKTCNYIEVEKLNRVNEDDVEKLLLPPYNATEFHEFSEFTQFLTNTYIPNNNTFYLLKPANIKIYNFPPCYTLFYKEEKGNKYKKPFVYQSFEVSEKKLLVKDEIILAGQRKVLMFRALFYSINQDSIINLSNLKITYLTQRSIQIKCDNFFLMEVNICEQIYTALAIKYIKNHLFKF